MNVAFLSHMFPSRVDPLAGVFVYEKASALSRMVHLDIISPVSWFPFREDIKLEPEEQFGDLLIKHPRFLALPQMMWDQKWIPYYFCLRNLWGKAGPDIDVLHIEWVYPDAYAAIRYANAFNFKTVVVVHGNEALGYFDKTSHRKKYIEAFRSIDKIIVVSNDLKQKMIREYSVPEEKITVMLNGVNLDTFPQINQCDARDKVKFPNNRKMGVCVARLSPEKNLHVLVEAVSGMGSNAPTIYIIGDGPLRSELKSHIEQLGVRDRVILVGAVPHDDIYPWLNAADFFCLPSQREGCPVVIHEALACGLPVLSTTVGAIPDLICRKEYGLLCPPSDVTAFGSLLDAAMGMTWDREEISAYGRKYTWDSVAEQTVKIFEEVVG